MPVSYQAALRMLAKEKGHFVLPKKGTADYDKVRKMMSETEMSPEHEVKKRMSKGKKGKTSGAGDVVLGASSSDEEVKKVMAPPPMKMDTELIDQPGAKISKKAVKNAKTAPKKSAKGGVKRTGETEVETAVNALENTNTGPGAVISNQLPGQEEKIKKSLKKKGPKIVEVNPNPDEATIDAMNQGAKRDDDIDGSRQFSFIEFKKKLMC
jgi:hypothetical protein